ncbi:MAG: RDD family protein [Cyclobacteriaceae bacterium]|nr:RDD family protein [Cyclobacteriaceae bacterium]
MKNYAGFWLRFVAVIIDGIIIGILQFVVLAPILAAVGIGASSDIANGSEADALALVAKITALFGTVGLIGQVVNVLYFSLMESSKFQATVGKLALGLIVTDLNGGKLDFVKALIRNVSKIVSTITFLVGYLLAAFTEKKQALHDIIAGTLVVKK